MGMSRARTGVTLVAAATILAGCGAQGGDPSASTGGAGGTDAVGAGTTLAPNGATQSTHSDGRSGAPSATTGGSRAVGKPPKGAYDDTTGTRTGKPHLQTSVLAHLPGPTRSACVSVGSRSVVRSGPLGMGSFSSARSAFAQAKTPYNAAPSFFYVIPRSRTAGAVTVVATRPGVRTAPVTVHSRDLEPAAQWHYFPIHLQIPSRGTWRFQVTVDGDRGCFVVSFT
jgi:hypothetical protein